MPRARVSFERQSSELWKGSSVVGRTDRIYQITGKAVTFDEVIVAGDLSGTLKYNGRDLRITRVESIVGLEVGLAGARGPVWRRVECEVLD